MPTSFLMPSTCPYTVWIRKGWTIYISNVLLHCLAGMFDILWIISNDSNSYSLQLLNRHCLSPRPHWHWVNAIKAIISKIWLAHNQRHWLDHYETAKWRLLFAVLIPNYSTVFFSTRTLFKLGCFYTKFPFSLFLSFPLKDLSLWASLFSSIECNTWFLVFF